MVTSPQRVTCDVQGPRNDLGKPKLVATIDEAGIWVWCRHCRQRYLVTREACIAAWERGEIVEKGCGHQQEKMPTSVKG